MISEVNIVPIKPHDGLIAFANILLNNELFIGSIAVHKRLTGDGYRMVYPAQRVGGKQMNICHPTTKRLSDEIEAAITRECDRVFVRSSKRDRHGKTTAESR